METEAVNAAAVFSIIEESFMSAHDAPPLIPREVLFGNPEKTSPQIAPDGTRLAYLAPDEGVLNVWVRTVGSTDDHVVTRDRKRGIRMYFWAFDSQQLLYIQDTDGDENWHVWSVNFTTGIIRDLTPFQGVRAELIAVDHRFPNYILVGLNLRDARVHDVYRIDLTTGAIVLEAENPGDVVRWLADSNFNVHGAYAAQPDGGFVLRVRGSILEPFRPLVTWSAEEEGQPYGFTRERDAIYIGSTIGTNTQELRRIDIETGTETTLASNPDVDLSGVIAHPTKEHIQAAGFNADRLRWTILDPDIQPDFDVLTAFRDGEVHLVSRDLADETWVVLYTLDNAPAAYYVYERATKKLDFLFTTRPALEEYTLAPMLPITITARDGLTLHCYLTLPPNAETPKPAAPLPLVLDVHGGPWARDTWGYNSESQWLANRGYATLQVNFRGSTGFGKTFLHAGDREWGAKMHDDLLDAVAWAVREGFADPQRVAIYGGSYGGYAALVGASFTPEVFACAIDVVGPSSLRTLIASIPPYWEPLKKLFTLRVGDPDTEPDFLDSRSPLYKADQITCPLLIAQGANDPRVKQAESEQIVAVLRDQGKEVEYLLFPDEGHGFARPENRLTFYAAAEKFLARYLGGRIEDTEDKSER